MNSHRLRSYHRQRDRIGQFPRLHVKVIKHFHVIGYKSNRRQHHRAGQSTRLHLSQMIQHIRLQPRLPRRPAAALICEGMIRNSQSLGDDPPHLFQLPRVIAALRHGSRNAVRRINDLNISSKILRHRVQRFPHAILNRIQKSGMIKKCPHLIHRGRAISNLRPRPRNVLAILSARRIRTVSRGHKGQRVTNSVTLHLP